MPPDASWEMLVAAGCSAQRSQLVVFSCSSGSLLRQFLSGEGIDGASICPTLELRKNFSHHCSDLRRATSDGCLSRGTQRPLTDLGGEILFEPRGLGRFLICEVETVALGVHLDRFAPALDRLAQYVDDIVVGRIASQLDLLVLDL